MQQVMFTGRLAADPELSRFGDNKSKAVFRLLQNRGQDSQGKDRVVGVNCVSWSHGLNEKVIMRGLAKGCEVVAGGYYADTQWEGQDGARRYAKELVVQRLSILDWAERAEQRAA